MSKPTDNRLELMESNNMIYACDESLSCVVQKEFKQNPFVSPNITDYKEGYQLIYNFDTLADDEYFIAANSHINLLLTVTSSNQGQTDNYGFGSNYNQTSVYSGPPLDSQQYKTYFNTGGSVLNLFNRVELITSQGQIIFSERFYNQNRTARQYEISQERMNTINAMTGGLCYDKKAQQYLFPVFATNDYTNFSIPLSEISPFFNQSRPIPSAILKNCILRITLEKPSTCVYLYSYGNFPSYQAGFELGFAINLKNVCMNYQTTKVFDSISKVISHNSIQIPYKTKLTVKYQITSSTTEFMIPLTAAQIFNVQLKFIRNDYNYIDSQADGGGGFVYNYNQRSPMYANDFAELIDLSSTSETSNGVVPVFKIRVGEYYYPQFNPSTIQDYYNLTCEALNPISGASCQDVDPFMKYNKTSVGCVNYTDYSFSMAQYAPITQQDIHYGLSTGGCIMAFDLRRNKDLGLCGITTNSNQKLSVLVSNIRAVDRNALFNLYITTEYLQILEYKDGKITIMK